LLSLQRQSSLSKATVHFFVYCFAQSGLDLCIQFGNLTA
jgi:hypothetical protein